MSINKCLQRNTCKVSLSKKVIARTFFLFIVLFFSAQSGYSQVLSGVVSSADGESIPFASIYMKELTTGTTTNLEGEYSLELPPGMHHISFQALGYAKVELEIDLNGKDLLKNVVLRPQDYQIKEVRVYSGNEDPAYGIMRKAISLAPYFLRQIKHYQADVYLKGGFDMNKVPRLFRKQLKEEGIEQGKSYVTESINEITFNAPNRYVHKQISKRSTIPNDSENEVMGFINYSFYDSDSELAISPLSRKAFSFYRFRYEGFFQMGEFYVNKIKVDPKKKNQKLFTGYIFIVDNYWNLHSVDLVNEQFFGKVRIKQVQEPVKGKAWLPVTHNFEIDAKMMGFKATANYGGSVKYKVVELDTELPVPASLIKAYADKETKQELEGETQPEVVTKDQKKIQQLLAKEDLNNREMMKLTRLMEKENQGMDQVQKSLQLASPDSLYKVVKDTVQRDTIDWNKFRPIPLSKKEIESFGIKDSLTLAMAGLTKDSIDYSESDKKSSRVGKHIGNVLGGYKYYSQDSSFRIKYFGILNGNSLGFNTVDAFHINQKANIKKLLENARLDFYPELRYAFGRNDFMWKTTGKVTTSYITHTYFYAGGGQWTTDFNSVNGIAPFVNTASTLLLKDNYMKLYKSHYWQAGGGTDLATGLFFKYDVQFQRAERLENSTDAAFGYYNKAYRQNNVLKNHTDPAIFNDRKSFVIDANLSYTPQYFYQIRGDNKHYMYSDYPTFNLRYKKGLANVLESTSKYNLLEFSVKQELEWNYMYGLSYQLRAGKFMGAQNIHFSEFMHFNTTEVPISFKDWSNTFNLLQDYKYSTNKWYIEGHVHYATPYLIIKNLPFLQDKFWDENVYLSHLTTPDFRNYNEIGYGITKIWLLANIGVFAGFEDMEFERWGFRLSFNFDD